MWHTAYAQVRRLHVCVSIKFRSGATLTSFRNINVFGLSFAITFSCVVIIVDLVLLKFLIYLSGFRRALAPRIDRWIQDGVFQLQRRSYESKEGMEWKYIDHEIPIPENDGPLEELDVKTSRGPGIHGCTKCSGNGDYGGSLGKFDSLQDDSVEFKANLDESKGLNDERRDFANSHTGSTSKND